MRRSYHDRLTVSIVSYERTVFVGSGVPGGPVVDVEQQLFAVGRPHWRTDDEPLPAPVFITVLKPVRREDVPFVITTDR
jgi:hypothetical protein